VLAKPSKKSNLDAMAEMQGDLPWFDFLTDSAVALFHQLSSSGKAMKVISLLVPAVLFASANSLELTAETWDQHVGGKTVFIKFQAPW